jgi:hypothetical protein
MILMSPSKANLTFFADGGGIRSISSLLILQELMLEVQRALEGQEDLSSSHICPPPVTTLMH